MRRRVPITAAEGQVLGLDVGCADRRTMDFGAIGLTYMLDCAEREAVAYLGVPGEDRRCRLRYCTERTVTLAKSDAVERLSPAPTNTRTRRSLVCPLRSSAGCG